jgi:hypothetical protein
MIAVPTAIGCVVVVFGAITILPKYLGAAGEAEALQECENMLRSQFHVATMEAPNKQREGQYEVFSWPRYKSPMPNEPEAVIGKRVFCKFDMQRRQVTHLSFD